MRSIEVSAQLNQSILPFNQFYHLGQDGRLPRPRISDRQQYHRAPNKENLRQVYPTLKFLFEAIQKVPRECLREQTQPVHSFLNHQACTPAGNHRQGDTPCVQHSFLIVDGPAIPALKEPRWRRAAP